MTQRLNSFSVDELCSLWKSEHFAYDRKSVAASTSAAGPLKIFPRRRDFRGILFLFDHQCENLK